VASFNFLEIAQNVVGTKCPLPEGAAGVVFGIKRYLSVNSRLLPGVAEVDRYWTTLGPERFYDLMRFVLPYERFIGRGLGKVDIKKLELNEKLRRRICQHFKISVRELPIFMDIWRNEGRSMNDLLRIFGFQSDAKTKRKTKKKRKAKKKRRV
jgi:hypothetical protein